MTDDARDGEMSGSEDREHEKRRQKRSSRVEIDGWINLDKPTGVSSTQAVGRLKFLFNAKKAGHAGTLDPLASGVLPVAFGEATKTVPIVQDGAKAYRFRIRWGEESATDDAEGEIVARSDRRPAPAEIEALLPRFVGAIMQTPPIFSAIRIDGSRAYDLAREGESFQIQPRLINVYRLDLISAEPDAAVLEAECGKGAYVRAIARDLGRALGCYGHVIELRRTRPLLAVDRAGAATLRRGQKLLLRGPAPMQGPAYADCFGTPIAFGIIQDGYFVSSRVFNLRG
jgi:tRNA pseudouridine55 synthase